MGVLAQISRALRGAADRLSQIDPPEPTPARPASGSQARRVPIYDRWHRVNHPGHGINPRRIVEIFKQAELGFPIDQCDLFEDMIERDPHLRSQHEQRMDAVVGNEWALLPGGDSEADRYAAVALEERLREPTLNLHDTEEHQLKANGFGWSGSEIQWDMVRGLLAPAWFSNLPPRRFRFDERDRPFVITDKNWIHGEPLEPGRWWMTCRSHSQIARSGYMRTATVPSYFKNLSLRDWIIFAERFGLPFVYGVYDEGVPDDDKDALLEMVKMLGKDGSAIFSRAQEIKIEHAQGGNADGVHAAIIATMDTQITKLITGSVLMADGGDGGSYAQSKVQQGVRFQIALADAMRLSRSFETCIAAPFVRFNGLDARAPRLKIHLVRDVDPATRMDLYCRAVNELKLEIDSEQPYQDFQFKPAPAGRAIPGAPVPAAAPSDPNPDK